MTAKKASKDPFFSIIIPVKEINDYIRECVEHILLMDYTNFEIIILPDIASKEKFAKTRIIPTGHKTPGIKRNMGARKAKGSILAFIDDDAFPRGDWLRNAAKNFKDEKVSAVGGPGVTPESDSYSQKVSGKVYEIAAGDSRYRYVPRKKREVDDFPSCNFLVRRKDYLAVGGFDESFWPGEDTKLCQLLVDSGKKIIYDPEVFVYHHRRKMLIPHLKQMYHYGLRRGIFARKFQMNAFKIHYFIPSLFFIYIILGFILSFIFRPVFIFYLFTLGIYLVYTCVLGLSIRNFKLYLGYIIATFISQLTYGYGFMLGVLKGKK